MPRVSMDYLYFGQTPTLIIKESLYKLVYALGVSMKGSGAEYIVKRVTSILDEMGHNKIILRSDQEPAIQDLGDELREERRTQLEAILGEVSEKRDRIIIKEHSGIGASAANGDVEEACKRV